MLPQLLFVLSGPLPVTHRKRLTSFATQVRIPLVSEDRAWTEAGALLAYGANGPDRRRAFLGYRNRSADQKHDVNLFGNQFINQRGDAIRLAFCIAYNSGDEPESTAKAGSTTEPASKTDLSSGNAEGDMGASKQAAIPTEQKHTKQKKQVEHATHADAKKDTRTAMRGRWDRFQTMVNGCDTKTRSAKEECLANARDTFRTANFKCEALGAEQRTSCLQFAERWNSAGADAPGE
jgi:hypothetical protein